MRVDHAGRAERHRAARDREAARSALVSKLRLATFLPALAIALWSLARGGGPASWAAAAVLIFVFAVLVVRHARIEDRAAWHDALATASLRGGARAERRWDDLPPGDPPAGTDLTHHPYALDLDVFGRASLFQWLGPAATPRGSARLAAWLLSPAAPADVIARQEAVAELSALDDWREQLAAHGILAAGARQREIDVFLSWAEAAVSPGRLHGITLSLTAAILILLALQVAGVTASPWWLLPMLAGLVVSFAMTGRIETAFTRAGAGERALGRYAALLEHATGAHFSAPLLREIQQRLSAHGRSAPACMRRLNRILGFAHLRHGAAILHFPIQAFTLWDFHVLFALDRWRRDAGAHMRAWLEALAELDALTALANVRRDHPAWCMPRISSTRVYAAQALGHPLIPDGRRVANDVEVGPPGTLLLVTGSNMSGKSTLLRAVGLNAVLAQAGGCVCAQQLEMPPADLQSSIRVQDSLELGLSYFMAALARLKGVVDAAEHERPGRTLLYLLDEILQGTNSAERGIAVRAVARHLLEAGAIGAMTTHDLHLAEEEPLKSGARFVHFSETVDESGVMTFDYRLRPGVATSRNALRLMKLIGIEL